MIGIAVVCILMSMANCEVNSCSDNDLGKLKQALFESMEYMEENDNNNDAVLFTEEGFGNVQSNIIKFMGGNQSIEEKFKGSVNLIGMKTPTKWTLTRHLNMSVWDFPKLVDIQNPIQDITIAFYLYQLLQNAKSLKILVFSHSGQIVQGSNFHLVRNLNVIERIFGNMFKNLSPSIGYIFKDLPRRVLDHQVMIGTYSKDIKNELESFAKRRDQTSSNIKNYLQYLKNNFASHASFSTNGFIPGFVEGQFSSFMRYNNSIQGTKLILQLPINILNSSKLCLSMAKDKLFPMQRIDQLLNIIRTKSLEHVQLLISSSEKTDNITELKALSSKTKEIRNLFQIFNSEPNEIALYRRIELFGSFFDLFENKTDRNLLRTVKFMNFVDKVLDTNESNNIERQFQDIVGSLFINVNNVSLKILEKLVLTMSKK